MMALEAWVMSFVQNLGGFSLFIIFSAPRLRDNFTEGALFCLNMYL